MILIFVIIIAFVYYNLKGQKSEHIRQNNPEAILKERFAIGEIDETTYLKMQLTLKK